MRRSELTKRLSMPAESAETNASHLVRGPRDRQHLRPKQCLERPTKRVSLSLLTWAADYIFHCSHAWERLSYLSIRSYLISTGGASECLATMAAPSISLNLSTSGREMMMFDLYQADVSCRLLTKSSLGLLSSEVPSKIDKMQSREGMCKGAGTRSV